MSNGRHVLTGDLDIDERLAFLSAVQVIVDSGHAPVEVDCSAVTCDEALDDAVIGMLVTLARAAQRCDATRSVSVRAAESALMTCRPMGFTAFRRAAPRPPRDAGAARSA